LESIDYLIGNEFKTHYFQLTTKLLTTQVYFDLFLSDVSYQFYLFNYFDSFEKWMHREKIRELRFKESFLRFIQNTRKLAKFYTDIDLDFESLNKLLSNEKNVQAFDWLKRKKYEVIEKRKSGHPFN